MSRQRRLVSIPLRRTPWKGDEIVRVCTRLKRLKGRDRSIRAQLEHERDYEAAKEQGDYDAAVRIVQTCVQEAEQVLDAIVDSVIPLIQDGYPLICVVPHPPFADDDGADLVGHRRVKNALPLAYAAYLAKTLGGTLDRGNIVQTARVGRTKLTRLQRLLWQPTFEGRVRSDAAYILVDDVLTLGGTLAALRHHILEQGGTVVLATTLAHRSGEGQWLALRQETWEELVALFGAELYSFWDQEIGHAANCLTEAEGRVLLEWGCEEGGRRSGKSLLQCLRDRLAAAAAKGE